MKMSHYKILRNQLDIKQNVIEASLLFDDYLNSLIVYNRINPKTGSKLNMESVALDKTPRRIKRNVPRAENVVSVLKKTSLPLSYLRAESILASNDASKKKSLQMSKLADRRDVKKYSLDETELGCSESMSDPTFDEPTDPTKSVKNSSKTEVKSQKYQDNIEEEDLHLERRPIEHLINEQYEDLTGFYRIQDFDNWDCDYDDDSANDDEF